MSGYTLRTIALMGATLTMGLITGAFALYAHTVMPGLKTTDNRTFVGAFQALDRAIINPWFMLGGWAYSGAIYGSSPERTAALDGWLWHYNHRRRHQAIGRQPPITRLNNLLGTYT